MQLKCDGVMSSHSDGSLASCFSTRLMNCDEPFIPLALLRRLYSIGLCVRLCMRVARPLLAHDI